MPAKKLKAFLDNNEVKYVSVKHSNAYTAQEIAATAHVSGKEFAKSVIVDIKGKMSMAVLPASYHVDFEILKDIFRTDKVRLATEAEFNYRFPDCELGAMPPFGNLYDMEVFVAESLAEEKEIVFNAGTHTEMIKMNYKDFEKMVQPHVFKFSWKTISYPNDPSERWASDV